MEYTTLGRTGVQVSELCFGTMSFGGDADEATSQAMYKRCREAGINFFDTANQYNKGTAEEILGRCIAGHREEVVLASKVGQPMGEDPNLRGGARRHVMLEAEKSLKRLGTDWLDVYFIHVYDPRTPMEEPLRAMEDLVRQGKILYPAISNYSAWQTMKARQIQALHGWSPVKVIQPMYNLVKRQAEVELLPMAQAEGLAVMPYSPVGGGLLSGKYTLEQNPDVGRLVSNRMYASRYGDEWMRHTAVRFTEFARERGFHPVSLAVAWVGAHPGVTCPIIGARNLDQLEDSLGSVNIDMTPELRAELSALSPTPPPATDRSEAQK